MRPSEGDPAAHLAERRRVGQATGRGVRGGAPLAVRWLGTVAYADALALQRELQAARLAGVGEDTVLLLEHPDVVTLGSRSGPDALRLPEPDLRAAGYALHRVNRGGEATYHGPGQLVGYPILDLRERARSAGVAPDVHAYLRSLEAALIDTLGEFGIAGRVRPGLSGVWLEGERKIASIGIGVRRWVTLHGFALNVACALERFGAIVPCGLANVEMVSMESVLGARVAPEQVRAVLERALREHLS
jgi:lipoate-protein ligase B